MRLAQGTVVGGDFRIERPLSSGGMGHVFVATQLSTGRERALKLMRADLVADAKLRQRFEQEARVGGRIASEHVVEVIAAGVDDPTGMPWLAMELLDGETLGDLVARRGGLSPDEASEVLGQVGHALAAAHVVGVIHRDIKPENVFVARSKRASGTAVVKVLDFGIAKVVADARTPGTAPVGTLLWMAPEQADAEGEIGPAADIWSFGMLAFFTLVGRALWSEGVSPAALIRRLVIDEIPSASARATELGAAARLPEGFDAWFARSVSRDPAGRFDSIPKALAELNLVLGSSSLAHAPTLVAPQRRARSDDVTIAAPVTSPSARRRTALTFAALAAGALVAGGIAIARSGTSASRVATPTGASASAPRPVGFSFGSDDDEDHETIWRVPVEGSPRRGGAAPLVTVVEFGDFECPYTRRFEDTAKRLLATYGADLALVWKDHAPDFHPIAEPAARLARLARKRLGDDGFWAAHDQFFAACADNERAHLAQTAISLGLPEADVEAALAGPNDAATEKDEAVASDLLLGGVPVLFFNGRKVSGARGFDSLKPLVEEELARGKALVARGVPRETVYAELQRSGRAIASLERKVVEMPAGGAVLAGAQAVIDVHEVGDETHWFTGLSEPVVEDLLQAYGARIRFHWHAAPEDNPTAVRVATVSEQVLSQNGVDVFWNFHRLLLDNQARPFKDAPDHPPRRGFGDDALLDYARAAGASTIYFGQALAAKPDPAAFAAARRASHELDAEGPLLFYVEGYRFGSFHRIARRAIEQALADAAAR